MKDLYNPQTGGRLDLDVHDEQTAVAATRWRARRKVYLQSLINYPGTSLDARAIYERELARLK